MAITDYLRYYCHDFWNDHGSPLVLGYPLMDGGPWKVLALVLVYLFVVKLLLPKFMANRKPFDLRWPIRVFNASMVLLNLWGFVTILQMSRFGLDIWRCPKPGPADTEPFLIWMGSIFLLSRLAEFADTVFFVLRKKHRQASRLHVFHHSVVPLAFWSVFKFSPVLENGVYPFINTLIHVAMYIYYTLATFGPKVQQYLWWKKYLTAMQLVQFIAIIFHSMRSAFIPGCRVGSNFFVGLSVLLGCAFFYLFFVFYLENYRPQRQSPAQRTTKSQRRQQRQHLNFNQQVYEGVCKCLHNGSKGIYKFHVN